MAFLAYQTGAENYVMRWISFGVAAALILYALYIRAFAFQCRENAVVKKSMFSTRELRYDQLAGFAFSKTAVYLNNVYQGTSVDLKFTPKPEFNGGSPISYKKRIKHQDNELESLCAHVSEILAQEMEASLKSSGKVTWTKNLELQSDGMVYIPSGLLGSKAPIKIPYGSISSYDVHEGEFRLWVEENPKSVTIVEPVSLENFFPGYELFKKIVPR